MNSNFICCTERFVLATIYFFFFFNDTATTEIYTLSLHDALPIYDGLAGTGISLYRAFGGLGTHELTAQVDRKSTRLNSSHLVISYAVFCLKKKKINSTRHKRAHCCRRYDNRRLDPQYQAQTISW